MITLLLSRYYKKRFALLKLRSNAGNIIVEFLLMGLPGVMQLASQPASYSRQSSFFETKDHPSRIGQFSNFWIVHNQSMLLLQKYFPIKGITQQPYRELIWKYLSGKSFVYPI